MLQLFDAKEITAYIIIDLAFTTISVMNYYIVKDLCAYITLVREKKFS